MSKRTDRNIAATISNRILMHAGAEAPWWWLSFCDGTRPAGSQFLGAVCVRGFDIGSASMEAHARGCNPGGEVMGIEGPPDFAPPDGFTNRLLTRAECEEFDRIILGRKETT